MKKNNIFLYILLTPFIVLGCKERIVVNNAYVYLVHDDSYGCGLISGEQWQSVFVGEYSTEVIAIPNDGYRFLEWSDGLKTPNRTDLASNDNDSGPIVFYAYFEVIDEYS